MGPSGAPSTALSRRGVLALVALLALWLAGPGTFVLRALLRDLDDPARLARRDHECFRLAGELVLAGHTGYEDLARTFANPPFAFPLVAALGALSTAHAYLVCALASLLGALAAGLVLARVPSLPEATPVDRARAPTLAVVVVLAQPALLFALHLGQWSGVYLLLVALAVAALGAGRERRAGVAIGLLALKPPLVLPLLVFAVAVLLGAPRARQRRFAAALALTLAALLALACLHPAVRSEGLLAPWQGFARALEALVARHEASPDSLRKQLTLYALLRYASFDVALLHPALRLGLRALALGALVLACVAILRLAYRTRATTAPLRRVVHLANAAVLLAVALNTYCFFYDGVLLAVPSVLVLTHGDAYASATRTRLARLAALLVGLGAAVPLLTTALPSPTAPLALAWLALELDELAVLARVSTPRPSLDNPDPAGYVGRHRE